MRLELGAGYRPTPGYTHQDLHQWDDIEIVGDASKIDQHPQVGPNSCSEIRATHLLEHFPYRDTVTVLEAWFTCLIPGGELYIEVPHIAGHVREWLAGEFDDEQLVNYIFGEQDFEGNFHYAAFTAPLLEEKLRKAGFVDVHIQDIGMVLIARALKPVGDRETED